MIQTITEFGIPGMTGEIQVKMPTNGQRIKLFDKAGIDFLDMEGLGDQDPKSQAAISKRLLVGVMDDMGPFCEKVDLKWDGKSYQSFDDIASDMKTIKIQIQIAALVMMGANQFVDKKKKKSTKQSQSSTTA